MTEMPATMPAALSTIDTSSRAKSVPEVSCEAASAERNCGVMSSPPNRSSFERLANAERLFRRTVAEVSGVPLPFAFSPHEPYASAELQVAPQGPEKALVGRITPPLRYPPAVTSDRGDGR
jgi:hypothetical protein